MVTQYLHERLNLTKKQLEEIEKVFNEFADKYTGCMLFETVIKKTKLNREQCLMFGNYYGVYEVLYKLYEYYPEKYSNIVSDFNMCISLDCIKSMDYEYRLNK